MCDTENHSGLIMQKHNGNEQRSAWRFKSFRGVCVKGVKGRD